MDLLSRKPSLGVKRNSDSYIDFNLLHIFILGIVHTAFIVITLCAFQTRSYSFSTTCVILEMCYFQLITLNTTLIRQADKYFITTFGVYLGSVNKQAFFLTLLYQFIYSVFLIVVESLLLFFTFHTGLGIVVLVELKKFVLYPMCVSFMILKEILLTKLPPLKHFSFSVSWYLFQLVPVLYAQILQPLNLSYFYLIRSCIDLILIVTIIIMNQDTLFFIWVLQESRFHFSQVAVPLFKAIIPQLGQFTFLFIYHFTLCAYCINFASNIAFAQFYLYSVYYHMYAIQLSFAVEYRDAYFNCFDEITLIRSRLAKLCILSILLITVQSGIVLISVALTNNIHSFDYTMFAAAYISAILVPLTQCSYALLLAVEKIAVHVIRIDVILMIVLNIVLVLAWELFPLFNRIYLISAFVQFCALCYYVILALTALGVRNRHHRNIRALINEG